jgi:hypothetical protein
MVSFFARWYCWLVSPLRSGTRGHASRLAGSSTHDMTLAPPPTSIAYHVTETTAGEHRKKRSVWTPVGAAWLNKDGKGFSVVLDVVPLDGRFMLREPLERESTSGMQPSEMT